MKVIAFYTADTPYELEKENLRRSLELLGIDYEFKAYTNRGSWERNCGIKPEFILEMLNKYKGQTLVYIDADAVVQRPILLAEEFNADFAVHYKGGRELLSGTLIMRSTQRVRDLIERWRGYQELNPLMFDQKTLSMVIKESQWHDLKIIKLPSAYVKIFDAKDMDPNPIIEHFQASRRFKAQVAIREQLPKGVRVSDDGNLWLPRKRTHLVNWLDSRYQRIPGGELRWMPKQIGDSDVCTGALEKKHVDCVGFIVGKGPSLDHISHLDFPDPKSPIFALNEAVRPIQELLLPNPIYSVIDPPLKEKILVDSDVFLLVNIDTGWYSNHPQRISYSTRSLGLTKTPLTGEISIKILQLMGIEKIVMLCFDACMGGELEYAKSIGHSATKGGALERFKRHRARFLGKLDKTDYEFKQVHQLRDDAKPQQP